MARCAHQCAHLVGQVAHHAVGRTGDITEVKVLLGRDVAGLSLCKACLGCLVAVFGRLQFVGTDDIVVEQFLVVLVSQFGGVELSFGGIHRSLGLTCCGLVGHIVDHEKQLAFLYRLSFMHAKPGDETRNLRAYLHVLHTSHGGGIRCFQSRALGSNGSHGILVVAEIGFSLLASTSHQHGCCSNKH